ncbi:MAG: hypothetical protein ABIL09_12530 [Gemmatimonadota bacterium]
MNDKIHRYYAHTIAGLEEVVMEDLLESLPGAGEAHLERGPRQGRVFFRYERSPRRLLAVPSALSVYGMLADVRGITVGKPGLERLCRSLERLPLDAARALVRACDPAVSLEAVRLSATVRGSHRFDGRELSRAAAETLERRWHLRPAAGGPALHLQIQVVGTRAVIGVQVGGRQEPGSPRRGGMEGPLAYCVARMMGIAAGDVVVAPGCSWTGAEQLAGSTSATVIGLSERRPRRTGAVRPSPPSSSRCLRVLGAPAALPVVDGGASGALAVFDATPGDGGPGTAVRLTELARALGAGGVLAAVTANPKAFLAALRQAGLPFELLSGLGIGVGGRAYGLYLLARLELSLLPG